MDSSLINGSVKGDTHAIYDSIQANPRILEEIDKQPFADTPMHVAAARGHTHFVVEMMRLKQSFARKLNPAGFSPIHVALQNGHSRTAVRMVEIDRELVRVKGRDGLTPLHCVAELGDPWLMGVLVSACPMSLEEVTSRNKTALHVAIERGNEAEDCVRVLLEGFERFSQPASYKMILNWRDDNGDTPLHIAVAKNQTQVVKALIDTEIVYLNEINSEGLTPLNISERPDGNEEIRDMLRKSVGDMVVPSANSNQGISGLDTFLKCS